MFRSILLFLAFGITNNVVDAYNFAMVSGNSAFFEPIEEGWNDVCDELPDVTCEHYHDDWTLLATLDEKYHWTPENRTVHGKPCVAYLRYLIDRGGVDAIATKCNVAEEDPGGTIIQEAADAGIPVVVFAGPHVGPYVSYIGTDNVETGRAMARLLKQLRPEGGTYAVTYNGPSSWQRSIGFVEEIEKDNDREDKAHWIEEPKLDYERLGWDSWPWKDVTIEGLEGIEKYLNIIAEAKPTAIGFMYQTPMRSVNYTAFIDRNRDSGMSYIGLEGNADELRLMARNYVDGLVGQQTYETGRQAATALYDIVTKGVENVPRSYPTKIINYNLVPDDIPEHKIDQHLLDNLKITGLVCFGIVVLSVLVCAFWTIHNRSGIVVKASQPFFLVMTAAGVLIMSGSFIPLSMDDAGQDIPESQAIGMCMSVPWLAFTGFAVTFSALFAKTWRVNQFFKSRSAHARIRVSIKDVMAPFFLTFSLNTIVLISWTVVDPLTYIRTFSPGTDLYNRDLESTGSCTSENATAFLVPLGLINLVLIGIACWQAVEARGITSEFAEAKWIGLTVFCMFQGFLTGIPIVVIVKDDPEAFYLILTFLLFLICMAVLLLIFLPKMLIQRKYGRMTPAEQKMAMAVSVKRSAGPRNGSSGFSSHNISGLVQREGQMQNASSISGVAAVSSASGMSSNSRLGSSVVKPRHDNGNESMEDVDLASSFATGAYVQRLDEGKARKIESSYLSEDQEAHRGGVEQSRDE